MFRFKRGSVFLNVCVIIIILLASQGRDEKQVEIGNIIATLWKKKIDEMAGRLAGRKHQCHFKAKSNHLHGYGEEKNLRTPLEMSFSLCFLRGKKILLIQSEKSKTCLYKLPILVILESKYLSLVSKGGEVMERNLTLTIN